MKISEPAEEILKKLWVHWVYLEENNDVKKELYDKPAVKELENLKLIEKEGDKIYLTPEGFEESRKIIKRRKLSEKSEKILHDVLGMNKELKTEVRNFEPVIERIVERCTCTPSHDNSPSPCGCSEGSCKCAAELKNVIEKSVLPLTQLKEGESGKIAYINSPEVKNLYERLPIDISPGKEVTIIRTGTSPLFQIDESKIALNKKIAEKIMVGTSK